MLLVYDLRLGSEGKVMRDCCRCYWLLKRRHKLPFVSILTWCSYWDSPLKMETKASRLKTLTIGRPNSTMAPEAEPKSGLCQLPFCLSASGISSWSSLFRLCVPPWIEASPGTWLSPQYHSSNSPLLTVSFALLTDTLDACIFTQALIKGHNKSTYISTYLFFVFSLQWKFCKVKLTCFLLLLYRSEITTKNQGQGLLQKLSLGSGPKFIFFDSCVNFLDHECIRFISLYGHS